MSKPTLKELRESVTQKQREFLDEIWSHFVINGDWPIAWEFHSPNRKTAIRNALKSLNGGIVFECSDSQNGSRYQLTLLGAVLTTKGAEIEKMVVRYFELLRKRYQTTPKERTILSSYVQVELGLDDEQTKFMGRLVILGNIFDSSASYDAKGLSKDWSAGMLREVEDFPHEGNLKQSTENFVLRQFNLNMDEKKNVLPLLPTQFQQPPEEIESGFAASRSAIISKNGKLIFVSHSSGDKDIADALIDLLCRALNLRVTEFLCTSVDGAKLRGGADTDEVATHTVASASFFDITF